VGVRVLMSKSEVPSSTVTVAAKVDLLKELRMRLPVGLIPISS